MSDNKKFISTKALLVAIPAALLRGSGTEKVYLLPKIKVKLGGLGKIIPVGLLNRNEVPPLLGRQQFMETLELYLSSDHYSYISDQPFLIK